MKDFCRFHASKPNWFWLGGVALGLLGAVGQLPAQIVTLTDGNSVAHVDPYSSSGMYDWYVQGQNQLQQQWFWYGVGNGPVQSIDQIATPIITTTGTRGLTATYVNPGNFSVGIDYLLTGGSTVGVGQNAVSDISEAIKIVNLSGSTLSFHFYQYSHFNLGGLGQDTVELGKNLRGLFNEATQTSPGVALTETVTTPGANQGEVAPAGTTLATLTGGGVVNLGTGNVGPVSGDVTWALQWDLTIAPGATALISKDKYLSVVVVPEPSALALLGLGLGVVIFRRRAGR